jgi:hypothetical protein
MAMKGNGNGTVIRCAYRCSKPHLPSGCYGMRNLKQPKKLEMFSERHGYYHGAAGQGIVLRWHWSLPDARVALVPSGRTC